MPRPEATEIIIQEDGGEEHPSWLLMRFSHVSGATRLFDSEIMHQHYVELTVTRCTRMRDLNHDWIHSTETLMEVDMSQAQFGALVSSFGNGDGVPATLNWLTGVGQVPQAATHDSRLDKSRQEVNNAATEAMKEVKKAHKAVQEAFDQKLGVKVTRERLKTLQYKIDQLPGNLEFAAKSLTEHVENVSTKMRADIEAMAYQAVQNGKQIESTDPLMIGTTWNEERDN